MRTTIELDDVLRAKLLELAARRGEKGFSGLIHEAVDEYLKSVERTSALRRDALKLRGCLSERGAERLRAEALRIRKSWR